MSGLGIWNVKDPCGGGILEARWILFFLPLFFLTSPKPLPNSFDMHPFLDDPRVL